MKKAPIAKIIPFSNVDGPGNRTSVFFQGCNFRCLFCHNPETIQVCTHCGLCVSNCPAGALIMENEEAVHWNSEVCTQCDTCIHVCPHASSPKIVWMTADDVMTHIRRTAPYIGGITVSGGECTLYMDFLLDLFPQVLALGKTCLIDSNGSFDFQQDQRILSLCSGVMLDVKAVSPDWSRHLIGQTPDTALKNLDFLLSVHKLTEVRTVILPHGDKENEATVRYVASRIGGQCPYKLIRYRPFGVREENQQVLGDETVELAYAQRFSSLARALGASKAVVV